jgi:NTP pyrophosphatase (non-canonical NTP hydrolase)
VVEAMKEQKQMDRDLILDAIVQERRRQDQIHEWNKKTNVFPILVEEVGEIAQALQGEGNLEEEIVQLAAVCVRWLEHL